MLLVIHNSEWNTRNRHLSVKVLQWMSWILLVDMSFLVDDLPDYVVSVTSKRERAELRWWTEESLCFVFERTESSTHFMDCSHVTSKSSCCIQFNIVNDIHLIIHIYAPDSRSCHSPV